MSTEGLSDILILIFSLHPTVWQKYAHHVNLNSKYKGQTKIRALQYYMTVISKTTTESNRIYTQLEIRSVERDICPIATSTMNELFL